jgi:hypothetical protein
MAMARRRTTYLSRRRGNNLNSYSLILQGTNGAGYRNGEVIVANRIPCGQEPQGLGSHRNQITNFARWIPIPKCIFGSKTRKQQSYITAGVTYSLRAIMMYNEINRRLHDVQRYAYQTTEVFEVKRHRTQSNAMYIPQE